MSVSSANGEAGLAVQYGASVMHVKANARGEVKRSADSFACSLVTRVENPKTGEVIAAPLVQEIAQRYSIDCCSAVVISV